MTIPNSYVPSVDHTATVLKAVSLLLDGNKEAFEDLMNSRKFVDFAMKLDAFNLRKVNRSGLENMRDNTLLHCVALVQPEWLEVTLKKVDRQYLFDMAKLNVVNTKTREGKALRELVKGNVEATRTLEEWVNTVEAKTVPKQAQTMMSSLVKSFDGFMRSTRDSLAEAQQEVSKALGYDATKTTSSLKR